MKRIEKRIDAWWFLFGMFCIGIVTIPIIFVLSNEVDKKFTCPTQTTAESLERSFADQSYYCQEVLWEILDSKYELITYSWCVDEPLDCTIDSRSPIWYTCQPLTLDQSK